MVTATGSVMASAASASSPSAWTQAANACPFADACLWFPFIHSF